MTDSDLKAVWIVLNNLTAKINELEDVYKADFETAKELIHCGAKNEEKIKELHDHISKLHDMINMEDRITASDILLRITQLETNVDFEKAEDLIYQGAQTHATILKLERKTEDLEKRLDSFNKMSLYDFVHKIEGNTFDEIDSRCNDLQKRIITVENWISQNYPQDRAWENDSWLELHERILCIEKEMPENGILRSTDFRLNRLESSSNCLTCKKINDLLNEKDL